MLLEELNEVDILRDDHRPIGPRSLMDILVRRRQEVEIRHVPYIDGPEVKKPPRQDRRQLRVQPDWRESQRRPG